MGMSAASCLGLLSVMTVCFVVDMAISLCLVLFASAMETARSVAVFRWVQRHTLP